MTTPRDAAAHAFVESVAAPVLSDEDRHHVERVLRVRQGTVITVADGRGQWRPVVLGPELQAAGDIVVVPASEPILTVAFAVVKADRPESIARALTEIGVDRLVPFQAERGVVRWDSTRRQAARERLRRVVRMAGMQSRRAWLPEVGEVVPFQELAGAHDRATAMAVPGGPAPGREITTVLVGPEGGWTPEELAAGMAAGWVQVGLGPHVLRTETAALVAGTLLVSARVSAH